MDAQLRKIFPGELRRQATFGLLAARDLQHALRAQDQDRVWYSVQSLLVATGNISKILWPPSPAARERGEYLRNLFQVTDDSPLEPRTLRNHFEHFDERIESWAQSSARRNFADSNIGPSGMIAGLDLADFLRSYDTSRNAVTFQGDSVEIGPLVHAFRALLEAAPLPPSSAA